MRPQLMMFCYGLFFIGNILSLAFAGRWFLTGDIDILNTITMVRGIEIQAAGGIGFLQPVIAFFSGALLMLGWEYPYLDNAWGFILKGVLLWPVSFGVIYGFIQLFSSIAQGIGGLVRNLLPG